MTPAELAALPELPAPTFTQREEIIDGERVMLPVLPPDLVPWRTPDDPVCVHDEYGLAWEVVRLGEPPQRWKMRRPARRSAAVTRDLQQEDGRATAQGGYGFPRKAMTVREIRAAKGQSWGNSPRNPYRLRRPALTPFP